MAHISVRELNTNGVSHVQPKHKRVILLLQYVVIDRIFSYHIISIVDGSLVELTNEEQENIIDLQSHFTCEFLDKIEYR